MVYECMNRIPGVYCNEVQGAMYAFLRVEILVRRPGLMLRYSILGQSILLNPIPFQFHSGSIPFRFGSILAHSIRTSTLLQAISITFHAQSHSIHFCEPELYLTLPVHTHTHTHTHIYTHTLQTPHPHPHFNPHTLTVEREPQYGDRHVPGVSEAEGGVCGTRQWFRTEARHLAL